MARQTLPRSDFADLADSLFQAVQYEAIRVDTLRRALVQAPGIGRLERELAEAEARGGHLEDLFLLVYGLIPFEATARAAIAGVLGGDGPAGRPRRR